MLVDGPPHLYRRMPTLAPENFLPNYRLDINSKLHEYIPAILAMSEDTSDHEIADSSIQALKVIDRKLRTSNMGSKAAGAFTCYPVSIIIV